VEKLGMEGLWENQVEEEIFVAEADF